MKTFISRFLSSAVLIALFCWILFSTTPIAWWIFSILAIFVATISTMEFHNFFSERIQDLKFCRIIAIIFSGIVPFSVVFALQLDISFFQILFSLLLSLLLTFSVILIFSRKSFESFISSILIFAPIPICIIPLVHLIPLYRSDINTVCYSTAFLIFVAKSGDISAYVFGTLTAKCMKGGNHKMLPSVSPKKSWEGFFSGFIISIAVAYFCKHLLPELFSIAEVICVGSIIYVVAVCGDLFESSIKRAANIKDSGSVIPGIGGLLDLTDSLILNAPLFYFYLQIKGVIK